jgi:hypothetical protein
VNAELKYGPQTAEVEALLERVRTLSDAEVLALREAWNATPGEAWCEAWRWVWGALHAARLEAAVDDAANDAWRGAPLDAVLALIARDLITPDKFTQAHYDLLTGPWRKVIGKVHPDDAELAVV